MTDLPVHVATLPGRLGATARLDEGELVLELVPHPAILRQGVVRTSVLSYLVDCVAGIQLDRDPGAWAFTTDMTVRAPAVAAPDLVTARFRPLRQGRRTAAGSVDLRTGHGALLGAGAIGFARVPCHDTDPPKPHLSLEAIVAHFGALPALTEPLPEAAGIEVVDAAAGVVQVPLSDALRNPAGTLQGAMVALIAEVAAEEAIGCRAGGPIVVTDLDLRYLDRTGAGPVRTRTQLLGDGPDTTVVVEIVDLSTATVTTLAHARGVARPALGGP